MVTFAPPTPEPQRKKMENFRAFSQVHRIIMRYGPTPGGQMHSRKPIHSTQLITAILAGLILSAPATAFTITSVTNSFSRIPTGLPGYGIAQGAAFTVIGTGVGQDPPTQATFP